MDTTGRAGLERAFEVAEQLARETHEEQNRARQRTSKLDRAGRWRGLSRSRSSSSSSSSNVLRASASASTSSEAPLVNSPWFTTVLGPPFLAECRWRWTFGPDGWEATQVRIARGERWVEVEWSANEAEGSPHPATQLPVPLEISPSLATLASDDEAEKATIASNNTIPRATSRHVPMLQRQGGGSSG